MAMNFVQAQRAQQPDLAQAVMMQNQIDAQIAEGKQNEKQGYMSAGTGLASAAPEGSWTGLGNAITGGGAAGGAAPTAAGASMVQPTTGAIASMTPEAIAASEAGSAALGIGASSPVAPAGLAAAEAIGTGATAAEGLAAASAGAGATGAGGIGAALSAMGPVGWAAMAAIAAGTLMK
jgi:hypothetical protein